MFSNMTLWKNLAVALVAAFALAACSSSDNGGGDDTPPAATGPTQGELDAANQRADEEKARADELQEEKDKREAATDRAAAKALFSVLRLSTANLAADPEEGATIADADSAADRDSDGTPDNDEITIPPLGESDADGMSTGKNTAGDVFTAFIASTKEANSGRLFAEDYATGSPRLTGGRTALTGAGQIALITTADDRAMSSDFPREAGTRTYPAGNREFRGSYDGAAGKYSCTGATCTVQFTPDGYIFAGTWVFDPDDGARTSVADANFVSYGWWLRKNSDGEIVDAGPVSFATGTDAAGVTALQGTATYSGSAAGKYAIYSGAFSERSEAGHFTADAMLKANFGDDGENGRVSGMIDNFMTEAGAKNDWSVSLALSGTSMADGLDDDGDFSGNTVWTIGDVNSDVTGNYMGSLHDSAKPGQDGVPYEARGFFDARFEAGVGELVGAFGATRD